MNTHNGEQQYSHEAVSKQFGSGFNGGGPPITSIQPLQVTGCNNELFAQVQETLQCVCGSEGVAGGPLCAALLAGDVVTQQPFSCMIELINNFSSCDAEIPQAKRQAAFKAFSDVTGYRPMDINRAFGTINSDLVNLTNYNAFYMFFPTLLLILIIIWLMVGFGWMNWVIGLFFTVLAIVILYGFSVLYRIHVQSYLRSQNNRLRSETQGAQSSFENSIAYWPQGLFAAACAVTCDGETGCWTCEDTAGGVESAAVCSPCNTSSKGRERRFSRRHSSEEEEEDAPRRKRKTQKSRRNRQG